MSGFTSALLTATGVLFIALGTYVLARNPHQGASRSFFLLSVGLGMVCMLQMVIVQSWDATSALLGIKVYALAILLAEGFFLFVSRHMDAADHEQGARLDPRMLLLMAAVFAVLAWAIDGAVPRQPGFGLQWGPGTAMFALVLTVLAVMAAARSATARRSSSDRALRSQGLVLSAGAIMPLFATMPMLLPNGATLEALSAGSFLATGGALGYLMLASALFQQPPVREPEKAKDHADSSCIRPGSTILFESKDPGHAFEKLLSERPIGEGTLVITRLHPDQVRERYKIGGIRTIWLCGQPGDGRIDPLALTILQNMLVEHVQKHKRSVVLIEGLEYLASENSIEKVLRLLYAVRDAVMVSDSKLLIPLDPDALGSRELALIERECIIDSPWHDSTQN